MKGFHLAHTLMLHIENIIKFMWKRNYYVLQKFTLKDIPMCNLSKIMHNIWLQQSGELVVCCNM
jgi:hypothetical protein